MSTTYAMMYIPLETTIHVVSSYPFTRRFFRNGPRWMQWIQFDGSYVAPASSDVHLYHPLIARTRQHKLLLFPYIRSSFSRRQLHSTLSPNPSPLATNSRNMSVLVREAKKYKWKERRRAKNAKVINCVRSAFADVLHKTALHLDAANVWLGCWAYRQRTRFATMLRCYGVGRLVAFGLIYLRHEKKSKNVFLRQFGETQIRILAKWTQNGRANRKFPVELHLPSECDSLEISESVNGSKCEWRCIIASTLARWIAAIILLKHIPRTNLNTGNAHQRRNLDSLCNLCCESEHKWMEIVFNLVWLRQGNCLHLFRQRMPRFSC